MPQRERKEQFQVSCWLYGIYPFKLSVVKAWLAVTHIVEKLGREARNANQRLASPLPNIERRRKHNWQPG